MAKTIIYPAAIDYLSILGKTTESVLAMGITLDTATASSVAENANAMLMAVATVVERLARDGFSSTEEHMQFCATEICGLMEAVRGAADALEADVSDELWPLPKYQEMLFIK